MVRRSSGLTWITTVTFTFDVSCLEAAHNAPADRGHARARQTYRMENQAGSRFRQGRFIERDM